MKLDGHHDRSLQAAGRMFICWLQAAAFTLREMIIDTKWERKKRWWNEIRQKESFLQIYNADAQLKCVVHFRCKENRPLFTPMLQNVIMFPFFLVFSHFYLLYNIQFTALILCKNTTQTNYHDCLTKTIYAKKPSGTSSHNKRKKNSNEIHLAPEMKFYVNRVISKPFHILNGTLWVDMFF